MKKIIRSTNDLLLSKKIITGVENGLGGMWAHRRMPGRSDHR